MSGKNGRVSSVSRTKSFIKPESGIDPSANTIQAPSHIVESRCDIQSTKSQSAISVNKTINGKSKSKNRAKSINHIKRSQNRSKSKSTEFTA